MQGAKKGNNPYGLSVTATDFIVYVRDKYFSVDVFRTKEVWKAKDNPYELINRHIYICGYVRDIREGKGNPLQYSCLGNVMGRGAWRAIVHGVCKVLDMT